LARRIAQERGVDVSQIRGTGPGGRIVQADILSFAEGKAAAAPSRSSQPSTAAASGAGRTHAPAPLPQRIPSGQREVIALNKMRSTIALRLQQSKQQIPHFYETIDVDAEAISSLREKLNKQLEPQKIRLSVSDFINKAIAATLQQHPNVNAHFSG